jgi:ABC-type sugar transport system permease subunit
VVATEEQRPIKNAKRTGRKVPVLPYVFLLPMMVSFILFNLIPVFWSFGLSFTNYNLITRAHFVGFSNYAHALLHSTLFWLAVRHTLWFVVAVPLGILISLSAAFLINALPWGQGLFRFIYYLPSALSSIAMGVLWAFLISFGSKSILSVVLHDIGFPAGLNFTGPGLFLAFVLFSGMLTGWGPGMVIFSAGLRGINREFYDAGKLDGAVGLKATWYITLPQLRLTLMYVIITGMIGAFQVFESLFVIGSLGTGSQFGPLNSGLTLVPLIYEKAFSYLQFGYASAIAFLMLAVIMVLTILAMRYGQGGQALGK